MAKKPWYSGKKINPAFVEAAKAHALECVSCGREPYTSARAHQEWRNVAEQHIGGSLPETFLNEAPRANRNVSGVQGNPYIDLQARNND